MTYTHSGWTLKGAVVEIQEFLRILLRRWPWLVIPPLLFAVAVGAYSVSQPKVYAAKASSYFSFAGGRSASDLNQGANYTLLQLASFASLATQPLVLDTVISDLGLNTTSTDLAKQIEVTASTDTVILDIRVQADTPEDAARIANEVNTVLGQKAKEISPESIDATTGARSPTITATVVSEALPPTDAAGPQTVRNTLIAFFTGLILGLLLAIARDKLDNRVLDADDLPEGLTTLGEVPATRRASEPAAWTSGAVDAQLPLAFGRVHANLRFASVDAPIRSLLVTSAVPGEGKSTVSVGLALALAETGARTLLIDADLRRPKIGQYLDLEASVGLADVLVGTVPFADIVQEWGTRGLHVLPAGTTPPNPKLLLDSHAMSTFLDEVKSAYDVVVVDSPPLLAVVDPLTLTDKVDGVLLVAGRGRVRKRQLGEAVGSLTAAKANLIGVVMNRMPVPRDRAEAYGY